MFCTMINSNNNYSCMRKQSLFFLMGMFALVSLSCRGNNQQPNESKEADGTSSELATVKTTYKGDLGQFALKGPVASVSPENEPTVRFNRDGQITNEDGSVKASDENETVERDAEGRIVKIDLLWNDSYETYDYNDRGLLVKYYFERFERKVTKEFQYNDDDELIHVVWTETRRAEDDEEDEEMQEETDIFDYKILERDSYGNWIRRIGMFDTEEKRTISYYK